MIASASIGIYTLLFFFHFGQLVPYGCNSQFEDNKGARCAWRVCRQQGRFLPHAKSALTHLVALVDRTRVLRCTFPQGPLIVARLY